MGQNFSRVGASILRVDDAATRLASSGSAGGGDKATATRPNHATLAALPQDTLEAIAKHLPAADQVAFGQVFREGRRAVHQLAVLQSWCNPSSPLAPPVTAKHAALRDSIKERASLFGWSQSVQDEAATRTVQRILVARAGKNLSNGTYQETMLKGHQGSVISATFSPDATQVVTASEDRTARLWDFTTPLQKLKKKHSYPCTVRHKA